MRIKITYVNKEEEVFEGTVKLHQSGCFQVVKEIKQTSSLALVEEKTDSIYIPFAAILKLETLNEE